MGHLIKNCFTKQDEVLDLILVVATQCDSLRLLVYPGLPHSRARAYTVDPALLDLVDLAVSRGMDTPDILALVKRHAGNGLTAFQALSDFVLRAEVRS